MLLFVGAASTLVSYRTEDDEKYKPLGDDHFLTSMGD